MSHAKQRLCKGCDQSTCEDCGEALTQADKDRESLDGWHRCDACHSKLECHLEQTL